MRHPRAADERLTIAWVAANAEPLVLARVQALCSLQAEEREAKARVAALAEMAAMVRCYSSDRFARYPLRSERASFSHSHLRLLVDSMAMAPVGTGVIYSS